MAFATYDDFAARFLEFARVGETQVQAFLDMAAESVRSEVWAGLESSHQFEAHLYLAAHLLAQSPNGNNARKEDKSDPASTVYGARYDDLRTTAACAVRIF